jgi:putative zinc binding protein
VGLFRKLERCRLSGSATLVPVLDLGEQALTGVFPRTPNDPVTSGPLRLVWCPDSGLLQLDHSFNQGEMYGENYGYRSGLNQTMVRHLTQKARELERYVGLQPGNAVLDIGSNDATLLKAYSISGLRRIGIDPTGEKFRRHYSDDITIVPEFFSVEAYRRSGSPPAKIVTSIAMFYDLEDPVDFARQVEQVLAPHLEYYSLGVVRRVLDAAGMRVLDVKMNAVNGGSFAARFRAHDRLARRTGRPHGLGHPEALPRVRGSRLSPPRRLDEAAERARR